MRKILCVTLNHQIGNYMNTIQKIKDHAALIMANGGPVTKEDFKVMKCYFSLTSGNAGNAGKRTKKNHNKNW